MDMQFVSKLCSRLLPSSCTADKSLMLVNDHVINNAITQKNVSKVLFGFYNVNAQDSYKYNSYSSVLFIGEKKIVF